jgi:hypothetical protein
MKNNCTENLGFYAKYAKMLVDDWHLITTDQRGASEKMKNI